MEMTEHQKNVARVAEQPVYEGDVGGAFRSDGVCVRAGDAVFVLAYPHAGYCTPVLVVSMSVVEHGGIWTTIEYPDRQPHGVMPKMGAGGYREVVYDVDRLRLTPEGN